jgi:Sulfotransferase domain
LTLQVIGAGLPRTGTSSLRCALESLLGGPCYHMHEVFDNLDHVPFWRQALARNPPDWNAFLAGYTAIVDWPGAAFWPELSRANPDALVVLSVRPQPGTWWRSADRSIFDGTRNEQPPELVGWQQMFLELLRTRLTPDWAVEEAANVAYEQHNERVRAAARAGACRRFLEWRATEGWPPLCRELGLPIPEWPFPHL